MATEGRRGVESLLVALLEAVLLTLVPVDEPGEEEPEADAMLDMSGRLCGCDRGSCERTSVIQKGEND